MSHHRKFFIDGAWVEPDGRETLDVINPATEEVVTAIALGQASDVDKAVAAARRAFESFSLTTREERLALMERVLECYRARADDLVEAVMSEMGAPLKLARSAQVPVGASHISNTRKALENFEFSEERNKGLIVREPIGVCALITPWNWPLNQIAAKVAPALATGCTVVLKPSEIAPLSAIIFAEIMEEAGVPPGVFNLVNGTGPDVGQVMAGHKEVDMVSFTGSTRAGIIVAKTAADTVKRVCQELGGKSPNIVLEDADFEKAVAGGVRSCFQNSGQSCDAPTRMLVPAARRDEALEIARKAALTLKVGDPRAEDTDLGPVVSRQQYDKIQGLIETAISEGATVAVGGPGRPDGINHGYYVKPTVFGHVDNAMTIAREEVFGPVLSVLSYQSEEEAIAIANDTPFGLAAYVQSSDLDHARKVAARLRAGNVTINDPDWDTAIPFGGYKQSGNGREFADWGMEDFLEIKGIRGYTA
ncbi:aldehyde dehydrogenase family protein [Martelella mediterranea]|uniref:3-succinoylsemialdehyde-pyridine dehydrogenase n=1 Tax=Martelella mediterranea DSM 17316 TaxID=1122214 RepID=A0A1U9YZA6_9HYPH|nr:aldehyde dehydrogenase family protein [Martelella mediterranea]AQZ50777.1 3-succinoylsemialdehyde-pyridine dehydrogenase [Martelella mediterranea DSM 17316]